MAENSWITPKFYRPIGKIALLTLGAGFSLALSIYISNLRSDVRQYSDEAKDWQRKFYIAKEHLSEIGEMVDDQYWPYLENQNLDIDSISITDDGSVIEHPYENLPVDYALLTNSDNIDIKIVSKDMDDIAQAWVCHNGSYIDYTDQLPPSLKLNSGGLKDSSIRTVGRKQTIRLQEYPLYPGDNMLSIHLLDEPGGQYHSGVTSVTWLKNLNFAQTYLKQLEFDLQKDFPDSFDKSGEEGRMNDAMEKFRTLFSE